MGKLYPPVWFAEAESVCALPRGANFAQNGQPPCGETEALHLDV
jgi:hypothetical protein